MLFLTETCAGYALFRLTEKSSSKLLQGSTNDIEEAFGTTEGAQKAVKMVAFQRFKDAKQALEETTTLIQGKMGKKLKKFLEKNIVEQGIKDELSVIDSNLRTTIKSKLGMNNLINYVKV